jgi:membrane protein DedA with SNARE-associated domain
LGALGATAAGVAGVAGGLDVTALALGAGDAAAGGAAGLDASAFASFGDVWRSINDHIVALAGSPWALVAVLLISAIDGFFPPVPAETLVIATAAVYQQSGALWQVALLWLLAAAGAVGGDSVAYTLGRVFNATEWRVFNHGKGRSAVELARRTFARGAAPLLMVGRFIPVGRVAVNLTAGTIRYPYRRFLIIDSIAALFWSAYAVGIGYLAGHATGDNPLLGVVVGVAFSASVGSLAQWAINRHYGKSLPAADQPAEVPNQPADAPTDDAVAPPPPPPRPPRP